MSVILMYHRVATPERDPYRLAVQPDNFAAHLEVLRHLGRVAPLAHVAKGSDAGSVAITFDDGYADNATVAAPMLTAAGLPATWFITSAALGQRRFWWDRLADTLLGAQPLPDFVDVVVADRDLWLDLRTPDDRETALRFLHRRLRPLAPDVLEGTVDAIIEALGGGVARHDGLTMTTEQVKELARLPGQEIGAHTRTHLQLRDQSPDLQRSEIVGSVADLSSLLGQPVRDFAYPFGSPGAVGGLAPRLVEESGCRSGCSTQPGRVTPRSPKYLLPRINVLDWDGPTFAARLRDALTDR